MFVISDPPAAGAAMATSDEQTSDAAASEEDSKAEDEDVEIRKHGLMQKAQEKSYTGENGDFVVIIDDEFVAGQDFGGHG